MTTWNLPKLFTAIQNDVVTHLETARHALNHPGDKGDASEQVWIDLLSEYLPRRYQVASAHVVDSKGEVSHQIDIVIFDRQYSPFMFTFKGKHFVPAESVYAVFEAKQELTTEDLGYAAKKIASVRKLHRTTMPTPTNDGVKPPKPLHHIIGGFLSLESGYSPKLGDTLREALAVHKGDDVRIDLGCVAAAGVFSYDSGMRAYLLKDTTAAVPEFLFALTARLQPIATVPMLDVSAYARHLPSSP